MTICLVQVAGRAFHPSEMVKSLHGERCGMTIRHSPTVRRRRLGIELRRLREAAGITIEAVADRLGRSSPKNSPIGTGHRVATPGDVPDIPARALGASAV